MAALTSVDLKLISLFSDLATEQLEQLLDGHRETTHQAEQLIVMEQDWGDSWFLLRSGLAKVRTYTADGDEVVMSVLGSGDVFGEMPVFDGEDSDRYALKSRYARQEQSLPMNGSDL